MAGGCHLQCRRSNDLVIVEAPLPNVAKICCDLVFRAGEGEPNDEEANCVDRICLGTALSAGDGIGTDSARRRPLQHRHAEGFPDGTPRARLRPYLFEPGAPTRSPMYEETTMTTAVRILLALTLGISAGAAHAEDASQYNMSLQDKVITGPKGSLTNLTPGGVSQQARAG